MKQTFYIIRNDSASDGMYFSNGQYKTIYPNQEIVLEQQPTNKTANVTVTVFRKEILDTVKPALNKKVRH